jgi:ABC-type nitrate/sulfonate/bicarbonate transport system permease component
MQTSEMVGDVGGPGRVGAPRKPRRRAAAAVSARPSFDVLGLVGVALLILLWYVATLFVAPVQLPYPHEVLVRIGDDFFGAEELAVYGVGEGGLAPNVFYTAQNVLIAVMIGSAIGVLVGLISARVRWFRALLDPIVLIGGTVPILVAAPFFLIWFGTGRASAVLLITLYTMFILIVFAQRAAENLNPVYESSARTLGAGRTRVLRDLLIPGTLPEILGGIRIALAGAWGLATIAELLGLPNGIGKVVQVLATQSDVEGILAAVLVLGVLGVVVDAVLAFAIRQLFSWRKA